MSFDPRISNTVEPGRLSRQVLNANIGGMLIQECFSFNPMTSLTMDQVVRDSRRKIDWVQEARTNHGVDMLHGNASFSNRDSVSLVLSLGWYGQNPVF
jgi:predicted amidohydrolase